MDASNSELRGSDYLDIVNEINDFIASLDAPPLDNHTHKLVGHASSSSASVSASSTTGSGRKKTFGNHGDDDEPPESWEGLRSRNRSGDDSRTSGVGGGEVASGDGSVKTFVDDNLVNTGGDLELLGVVDNNNSDVLESDGLDESSLSFEHDLENIGQFPVLQGDRESVDPFATYDYVGGSGDEVGFSIVDYGDVSSDCSNTSSGGSYSIYSDGSGSNGSSCEAADSDSGCYSYTQYSSGNSNNSNNNNNSRLVTVTASGTTWSQEESLLPSGAPGKSVGVSADSISQHQQQHRHRSNQSSDNGSNISTDHSYLGIGSSAHSILSFSTPASLSPSSSTPHHSLQTRTTPAVVSPNREQQQHHHHPSQNEQHSFLPKDHHQFPHHFQNSNHQRKQEYHHQNLHHLQHSQGQGQYSAPTSPAVKRKLFHQGVVADIKTGRSFDDSTHHNLSPVSTPTSPASLSSQVSLTSPGGKSLKHHHQQHHQQQSKQQQVPQQQQPVYSTVHDRNPARFPKHPHQPHHQEQQQHQQSQSLYNTPAIIPNTQNPYDNTDTLTHSIFTKTTKNTHHSHHEPKSSPSPQPPKPRQGTSTSTTSTTTPSSSFPSSDPPPPKAPDLSVLISELLSVAPSSCDASPSSPAYTDFARSVSVSVSASSSSSSPSSSPPSSSSFPSPASTTTTTTTSTTTTTTSSQTPESSSSGYRDISEKDKHLKTFQSSSLSSLLSSSSSSSSHYQIPPSTSLKRVLPLRTENSASAQSGKYSQSDSDSGASSTSLRHTTSGSGSANEVPRCSFSPEHDYEPIENIQQLDIPTSPRPETKFPHSRGQKKMADVGGAQPKHVKALHNFKGSNNDELCFKKGDIITVTQCLEGGWWEGTLNGRTGWFPSNYAKEVRADISLKSNKSGDVPVYKRESMQLYHNVVLKNVIETEKTHVSELIKVLRSYIKPIEDANLLSGPEYKLLVGNLEEVIAFQQTFLSALEECEKLPSSQRRIGGVFMQFAPDMKDMYSLYCANHPRSVSVLQNKREDLSKFVESVGAPSPGAQALTTILSKPFTRLDKYPSLLKELERHVEESHPDRGDTQRAIAVYRNIVNTCSEIRKMKEMEHEIITSTIQGWEGEEISKLGEVLHLSQVKLHTQTGEKFERIFLLFQSCLVMLSMSSRLSSYQYEGNIPLSGLSAATLVDGGDCFEINGPMIEKITVSCGSKTEAITWMELLNGLVSNSGQPASSAKPQPLQVHMISTCQPSLSTVTSAKTAQISSTTVHPPPGPTSAPPPPAAPTPPSSQNPLAAKTSCVWSLTCLRPSPPSRPSLMCRDEVLKSPRAVRKSTQKRKPDDPKVYNEDAFILQVIEAYCNSVKTRHTVNSSILNSPQILLAEEEKIFDESEQQERTVVDTVYALQDRVKDLEQEQRKLRTDLDEERRCRRKLEMLVRGQVIKSGLIDNAGVAGETNAT